MIIRNKLRDRYVIISKIALEDSKLSWKAKGLLCFLLSKPDNWNISAEYLRKQGPDGMTSVLSGLKELKDAKYLWRKVIGGANPGGVECWVFEEPHFQNPFEESDNNSDDDCFDEINTQNRLAVEPISVKTPPNEQCMVMNNEKNKEGDPKSSGDKSPDSNSITDTTKNSRTQQPIQKLPPLLDTPLFRQAWEDWIQYRKESKIKPYKPISVERMWRQMEGWGHDAAIAQIELSIANGYQGVFPPKTPVTKFVTPAKPKVLSPAERCEPYKAEVIAWLQSEGYEVDMNTSLFKFALVSEYRLLEFLRTKQ